MRLIVAGGGTGGHLYPGLAIAEEVRDAAGEVLFVGSERGIEARAVPLAGFPLECLRVTGLARMGVAGKARGLGRLPPAVWQSLGILKRFRPDVVMGVGGYASGPLLLAALLKRCPVVLQEQNSVPGMTNRFVARFARRIYAGFAEAAAYFPPGKTEVTGNPVRRAFLTAVGSGGAAATRDRPSVLVVGGSQGARAVNELVVAAVGALAAHGPLPALVHQTGKSDAEATTARYAAMGAAVDVRPFIDDMVSAYRAADLVVGRAGALTLAELAVLGKPAILIPLPTAADDHQTRNAEAFARAGAAVVAKQGDTTPETLARLVQQVLRDPPRLAAMGAAMKALGKPDAARDIVSRLRALVRS